VRRSLISLYGPPGSGKSRLGRELAQRLGLPFWDADDEIQQGAGISIPEIFSSQGESGFRRLEKAVLSHILDHSEGVIALGGGALLDPENRKNAETAGPVICLEAPLEILLERLRLSDQARPLLVEDLPLRLEALLTSRADHYASFSLRLDASLPLDGQVWQAQILAGAFRIRGMGQDYDVRVVEDGLGAVGEMFRQRGLRGPVAVVSDDHVSVFYGESLTGSLERAGIDAHLVVIPAGEAFKNIQSVSTLYERFLECRLERGSTVVALGGGVVGDLAGFAAATFLRGVPWVGVPTSLLAMVDASLGGKTGVDLPQGKNLVGAFHAPRLVVSDVRTLATLPKAELVAGMAEVVKAGIIGDPVLFAVCAKGWEAVQRNLDEVVRRAMAVKISVIEADPYEQGRRASLNLGHTIGHAVELVSGFALRHGEAVAIGMVAEAQLSERLGVARAGLAEEIKQVLQGLGLPVEIPPGLDVQDLVQAMRVDKKRRDGKVRFALPLKIGSVRAGVEVDLLSKEMEYTGLSI
jgi:3-dehydroquinate synthase